MSSIIRACIEKYLKIAYIYTENTDIEHIVNTIPSRPFKVTIHIQKYIYVSLCDIKHIFSLKRPYFQSKWVLLDIKINDNLIFKHNITWKLNRKFTKNNSITLFQKRSFLIETFLKVLLQKWSRNNFNPFSSLAS